MLQRLFVTSISISDLSLSSLSFSHSYFVAGLNQSPNVRDVRRRLREEHELIGDTRIQCFPRPFTGRKLNVRTTRFDDAIFDHVGRERYLRLIIPMTNARLRAVAADATRRDATRRTRVRVY